MIFSILTLFPEVYPVNLSSSIIGRAQKKNLVRFNIVNMRDFATDRHKSVDDRPYGGGAGMIIRVDIVDKAINSVLTDDARIILLDPKGKRYNQKKAEKLKAYPHLILICGHYEGFDARVDKLVHEKISVGDYILSGGETASLVIIDSITRLLPGALGNNASVKDESFSRDFRKEYPQYTRPEMYRGWKVPEVLLNGNHQNINNWRKENSY